MKENKGKSAGIIIFLLTFLTFCGFFAMTIAPGEKVVESNGLKIIHNEETDAQAGVDFLILTRVESPGVAESLAVNIHYLRDGEFQTQSMNRLPDSDYFGIMVPGYKLGERTYYYIEALDGANRVVNPENAGDVFESEYNYFKIRWEGKATFILLLLHIVLMVTALFLLIHALYYAMYYLQTGEKDISMIRAVNAGILAFFITGFPIGCIIEKQVLGNYWEGIPFGTDITDSKTLIILLLWLVFMILQRKGIISNRSYARWVIINTVITIILFLLPHSL